MFKKKEKIELTEEQITAKKRKVMKIRFILTLCLLVSVCIFNFTFRIVVISGDSMEPNFHNGTTFLAKKNFDPWRFDVVIINNKSNLIIKRVIGLPTETVECKNNQLYINGEALYDMYSIGETEDFKITLGPDEFYCLGDNREHSQDSRIDGPYTRKQLFAKLSITQDKEKTNPNEVIS